MKRFFGLVSVALLIQMCLTDSIGRTSRQTEVEPKMNDVLKEFSVKLLNMMKTVHNEMPEKYQEFWKDFREKHINAETGICFKKLINFITDFNKAVNKYQTADATEDDRKVYELFKRQGLESMRETYLEEVDKAGAPNFVEKC